LFILIHYLIATDKKTTYRTVRIRTAISFGGRSIRSKKYFDMATCTDGELINLHEPNGMSVGEFITLCGQQQLVADRFYEFLVQYCKPAITLMCSANESILPIDYCLLITKDVTLAHYTNEAPREMVAIFNEVLPNVVRSLYPMYVCNTLKVAIANVPLKTEFSDLSRLDLIGKLVRLDVIVVGKKDSTAIAIGRYNCGVCKFLSNAILGDAVLHHCEKCQNKNLFTLNNTFSTFKSICELHVHNVHNTSMNHIMRCHADSDLCKHVLVGSSVIITGVYTRSPGSKIFLRGLFFLSTKINLI
jgi:DNA replicative helicase MCM subunit Mcm2 (Cdc46/Mcm family)